MTDLRMDELASLGEEVLEHYGVKGMKWGVRRSARTQVIKTARANDRAARRAIKDTMDPAAKQILKDQRKRSSDTYTRKLRTPGEDAAISILYAVGGLTLSAIGAGAYLHNIESEANSITSDLEKANSDLEDARRVP